METENASQITFDQFKKGCQNLGVDTLDKWKKAVATGKKTWRSDQKVFKEVYEHAFVINREVGKNNLDTETACIIWEMFLKDQCKFLPQWIKFLEDESQPNVIKKDQWGMFYELVKQTNGDFSVFAQVDDGTWPGIIDDFADFMDK